MRQLVILAKKVNLGALFTRWQYYGFRCVFGYVSRVFLCQ